MVHVGSVGIGMLGSGFIGEFHADGLRYVPNARIVANYGAGPDRRAAFAARFGSRPAHSIRAPGSCSWLRSPGSNHTQGETSASPTTAPAPTSSTGRPSRTSRYAWNSSASPSRACAGSIPLRSAP